MQITELRRRTHRPRVRSLTATLLVVLTACSRSDPPTAPSEEPDFTVAFVSASVPGTPYRGDVFLATTDGIATRQLTQFSDVGAVVGWSPDGSRIAFTRASGNELWTMSATGADLRRVPVGAGQVFGPTWAPDGRRLAFLRATGPSTVGIAVVGLDGGEPRWVVSTAEGVLPQRDAPAWAPDGSRIAFAWEVVTPTGGWGSEIWTVAPDGTQLTRVSARSCDDQPQWSPDSRRLVFISCLATEGTAITVSNADGSERRQVTGGAYDRSPAWSPDGRDLLFTRFTQLGSSLYVVPASGGTPRRLLPAGVLAWSAAWRPGARARS